MKNKRLNEKMGGGSRIGLGGVNSTGPYYKRHKTRYPTGYHTGGYTGDADSQISQRHTLAKLKEKKQELEEYLENNAEDINESILNFRVKNNKKYMLVETLNAIQSKRILNESFVGKQIHKYVTLALMMLFDDATGELSGIVAVLPILYKNVYEIRSTNKKIEKELAKPKPDQKKLEEFRKALISDITDIVNGIILAFPGMGLDDGAALLFSFFNGTLTGEISQFLKEFESKHPRLYKSLYILSFPLGGTVIFTGLMNVDKLSKANINRAITNASLPSGTTIEDESDDMSDREVIDVTDDMTVLEMLNSDMSNVINELFKNEKSHQKSLNEFFARMIKLPLLNEKEDIEEMHCHCEAVAKNEASHCPIHGERLEVDEMSTVASLGGVPVTPLGKDSKGNVFNKNKRKQQLDYFSKTYGIK